MPDAIVLLALGMLGLAGQASAVILSVHTRTLLLRVRAARRSSPTQSTPGPLPLPPATQSIATWSCSDTVPSTRLLHNH